MHQLEQLEDRSVHILREAYAAFKNLGMLWSIGKDSTVLLWLTRKAFFGHVPFPLIHIDTSFKIPEMIEYRDRLVAEWDLQLMYGQNDGGAGGATDVSRTVQVDRMTCCCAAEDGGAQGTLSGEWPRYRFNQLDEDLRAGPQPRAIHRRHRRRPRRRRGQPVEGALLLAAHESEHVGLGDQPPEFWNQYKTDFAPGTHVRIHPLLDWTELNIWEYIERESIPVVPLYFDRGDGCRYRSLGCAPMHHSRWSRRPRRWPRSSSSSAAAGLPTSPSDPGVRRMPPTAAASKRSAGTATCKALRVQCRLY